MTEDAYVQGVVVEERVVEALTPKQHAEMIRYLERRYHVRLRPTWRERLKRSFARAGKWIRQNIFN